MRNWDMTKIMVIDDSFVNNVLCEDILTSEGYRVVIADNSDLAFEQVKQEKPDLIFLDLMMPKVDGFEVLSKIKSNNLTSKIPVVILSANTNAQNVVKAHKLGAVDYLFKPFVADILLEKVNKYLQKHAETWLN